MLRSAFFSESSTSRFFLPALLLLAACSGPAQKSPAANSPREPEPGFFERLGDRLTARECEVFRFTCPYGFGPAGEPCECTDGRGYVFRGRTIKR